MHEWLRTDLCYRVRTFSSLIGRRPHLLVRFLGVGATEHGPSEWSVRRAVVSSIRLVSVMDARWSSKPQDKVQFLDELFSTGLRSVRDSTRLCEGRRPGSTPGEDTLQF